MKRDTRQEILQMAKKLFNERGFHTVSTQEIASALGISKGNLTYHFQKKEDIMAAILAEGPKPSSVAAPETLLELHNFLLHIQDVVEENAFYFWHHAQLAQLSPDIRTKQTAMYQSNVQKLTQAFHTLQKNGIFRAELYPGEYSRTIDSLLLASIYWLPFCALKETNPSESRFQEQAFSTLFLLLTEEGKKQQQEAQSRSE